MSRSTAAPATTKPILRPLAVVLTALAVLTAPVGRRVLAAGGRLEISVVDRATGQPIAVRMHLANASGRPQRPKRLPFWHDHFAFAGKVLLELPVGDYTFEMERGPEYVVRSGSFRIDDFAEDTKQVDMHRFVDMSQHGWWSGDLYVRRPVAEVPLLMQAEDLHVAEVVTWLNDQTWPAKPPPADPLVCFDADRCYHVLAGGHSRAGSTLLYFHLPAPLHPADAGQPPASADQYPPPIDYALKAHQHPDAWIDLSAPFWWDLPMLVAAGQVDSIQLAHSHLGRQSVMDNEADGKPRDKLRYPGAWGNARWSHDIYFKLLECGLRIPPTAGSGSGVVPNPVGYNRVYVHLDGPFGYAPWWKGLRAGRVVVTNGPLLRPSVHGRLPGHVFQVTRGEQAEFEIGLTLSTRQPISYLEIIKNGQVEHSIRFEEYSQSGRLPKLSFQHGGWFLVRAVTDLPKTYRFAITGPYYVEVDGQPRISKQAAEFFLDWVYQRARQIKLADPQQQRAVLAHHRRARDFWQDLVTRANAP
ncbi:MAG: hypothetical protein JXB62_15690 [Pirellulales bacterium]|nr:hypothetical protein [Pirellulales bacterium]